MKSAVIDACVLYSAFLRDLTMRLTVAIVFQPKWTEQIHDEWMRNVLLNRPDLAQEPLERTRNLMNHWGRDCIVTGYEALIPTLSLPDADDRHVLAAAIRAKAPVIVTFNLSDFPETVLSPYGIVALHPDVFLCQLMDEEEERFLVGVQRHRASLHRPPQTETEYLLALKRNRLLTLAERLLSFTF